MTRLMRREHHWVTFQNQLVADLTGPPTCIIFEYQDELLGKVPQSPGSTLSGADDGGIEKAVSGAMLKMAEAQVTNATAQTASAEAQKI